MSAMALNVQVAYFLNPKKLLDVNECELPNENPCLGISDLDGSKNRCLNIQGSYICCDLEKKDDECIRGKFFFNLKNEKY